MYMPSPKNTNTEKNSADEADKSFTGNEEKQIDAHKGAESSEEKTKTDRDDYRTRNLEIEKERD